MGAWSKFFCRGSRNCGLGRGASAVSEEFRGEEPSVGEAGGDQISRGFVFERCAVKEEFHPRYLQSGLLRVDAGCHQRQGGRVIRSSVHA